MNMCITDNKSQYPLFTLQVSNRQKRHLITLVIFYVMILILFNSSSWAATSPQKNAQAPTIAYFSALKLQNTLWWDVAQQHQLDPYVLYAVALVESAKLSGKKQVTPWPWALNKAGKAIIPNSHQDARAILHKTLNAGSRNIDVGLMQINIRWQGHRVNTAEQLLNPLTNLHIGALVLAEAIQSAPSNLTLGVGRYHSWQNQLAALAYGRKVLTVADNIRAVL